MLRSVFGRKKGRRPSRSESSRGDESIRSARVGDVVVISGFSPALEDAYVVTEKINRRERRARRGNSGMRFHNIFSAFSAISAVNSSENLCNIKRW